MKVPAHISVAQAANFLWTKGLPLETMSSLCNIIHAETLFWPQTASERLESTETSVYLHILLSEEAAKYLVDKLHDLSNLVSWLLISLQLSVICLLKLSHPAVNCVLHTESTLWLSYQVPFQNIGTAFVDNKGEYVTLCGGGFTQP